MTAQEIKRLLDVAVQIKRDNPSMRRGQAVASALAKEKPLLHDAYVGTEVDAFYDDSKLTSFIIELGEDLDISENVKTLKELKW